MAISSLLLSPTTVGAEELNFRVVATTDVHGAFFPYDFINKSPAAGSLSRVSSRVRELRDSLGSDKVILLDNGDILQGQPSAYYYNFIDTASPHPVTRMLKFIGYDAQTIGNHDVETGHDVYDRYAADLAPIDLLAANAADNTSGLPYFKPYTILNRDGVKIAVLGLITPAIPAWLPEKLREGIIFDDMVESASKWVEILRETENPDILIGLFHSGVDSSVMTGKWRENASLLVADSVPGFDLIIAGHDHKSFNSSEITPVNPRNGALVLNPANNAINTAEAEIKLTVKDGRVISKSIAGEIVRVADLEPDTAFIDEFKAEFDAVNAFVDRKLGVAKGDFSARDAYFGPSAFMQLLHDLQLKISGAEISFAAPLSFDAMISGGDLSVSDMFKLYKYENMLYTMQLTGREIKDYLEYSYSKWVNTMESPEDHLILFADDAASAAKGDYSKLRFPAYNFDSAAGISYTVDVTKKPGERVTIISMADGTEFSPERSYTVAVNSYRGNGGGDLLTLGAGIPHDEISGRVIASTDRDLRFYLIKEIENMKEITPKVSDNWKFIPSDLVAPAASRDRELLFPQ